MAGFSDAEVAPLTSINVRTCPLQNCPRQAVLGLLVRRLPNILGQLRRVGIPPMPHACFVCCMSSLELTGCQPDAFLRGVSGSYCCFIYYKNILHTLAYSQTYIRKFVWTGFSANKLFVLR